MTFEQQYSNCPLYSEPIPNIIRMKEWNAGEPCAGCGTITGFFDVDTQQYVCCDHCLTTLRTQDAAVSAQEDILPDAPEPQSRLVEGRIEKNWMDMQAPKELHDILRDHPEFIEATKSLTPGDALVYIYKKLGGSIETTQGDISN